MLQVQTEKLQAKGISQDQIDRMQHVMHIFSSPAAQTATNFASGMFFGTIFALIVAAFLKRDAAEPPLAAQ